MAPSNRLAKFAKSVKNNLRSRFSNATSVPLPTILRRSGRPTTAKSFVGIDGTPPPSDASSTLGTVSQYEPSEDGYEDDLDPLDYEPIPDAPGSSSAPAHFVRNSSPLLCPPNASIAHEAPSLDTHSASEQAAPPDEDDESFEDLPVNFVNVRARCPVCLVVMVGRQIHRHLARMHPEHPGLEHPRHDWRVDTFAVKPGPPIDGQQTWVICLAADEGSISFKQAVQNGYIELRKQKKRAVPKEVPRPPAPAPASSRNKKWPTLERPVVIKTGDPTHPLKCSACDKAFTASGALHSHIRKTHFEGPTPRLLKASQRQFLVPPGVTYRYGCPEGCDFSTTSADYLWDHMRLNHDGSPFLCRYTDGPPRTCQCPYCFRSYHHPYATAGHVIRAHKDKPALRKRIEQWWMPDDPDADAMMLRPVLGSPPGSIRAPAKMKSRAKQHLPTASGSTATYPLGEHRHSQREASPAEQDAPPVDQETSPAPVLRIRGGSRWSPASLFRLRRGPEVMDLSETDRPTGSSQSGGGCAPPAPLAPGPTVCALCNYGCKHNEHISDHLRAKHKGELLSRTQAEQMDIILCQCGMVTRRRGWGAHASSCPQGEIATEPTCIRAKGVMVPAARQTPSSSAQLSLPTGRNTEVQRNRSSEGPAWLDGKTDQELLQLLDSLPTVYKFLPPGAVQPFIRASQRLAQNFLDDPSERTLFLFLALPKLALAPGLKEHQVVLFLNSAPDYKIPATDRTTRRAVRSAAETAKRYVQAGRLSDAMSALEEKSSVAEVTPDVLESLKAKHPAGPGPLPPAPTLGPPTPPPETEDLLGSLASFRKDTAAGISGWTVNLLTLACKNETVQRMMTAITADILNNSLPGAQLMCASRITALDKPGPPRADGSVDVRPVAVGEIIYRVATKAIVRKCFRKEMLAPFQLGVGSPVGVEPIATAISMAIGGKFAKVFKEIVASDATNAFNTICRRALAKAIRQYAPELYPLFLWAYGTPTPLLVRTPDGPVFLQSAQGVRQGDPLSALFFSIGVRPELEAIAAKIEEGDILLAYMDDFFLLSQRSGGLDTIVDTFRDRGSSLKFNLAKCRVVPIQDAADNGFEVLGTMVGSPVAQRAFLAERIADLKRSAARLNELPSQHALLLLRICVLPRIRHLLRTLDPEATRPLWIEADKLIAACVSTLRWSGPRPGDEAVGHALVSLPIKMGGLGLLSFADISEHAAAASAEAAQQVLSGLIPTVAPPPSLTTQRRRCEIMHEGQYEDLISGLHHAERMTVIENGSAWGRRWLSVIPSNYFLWMSDTEVAMALQSRTLVPPQIGACQLCGRPNPAIDHAESCAGTQRYRVGRHEAVKYALARALRVIPETRVDVEPVVIHSDGLRGSVYNDVRFSGSMSANLPPMEFDVKVTGVMTDAFDLPMSKQPTTNIAPATERHLHTCLAALAQRTIDNLPPSAELAAGATFHPFVLSAGGVMEKGTMAVWKKIKDKLPVGTASLLRQQVSVGLMQRRAAAMAAVEGNRTTRPHDARRTWSVWAT